MQKIYNVAMKSLNIKQVIGLLLIIIWMVVIFLFSNQQGNASSVTSNKVTKEIIEVLPSTKNLEENQKNEIVKKVNPIMRKIAHYTIYLIGGILIMFFISTIVQSEKRGVLYSILIGLAYAITDEIHQMFMDGRTAKVTDVFIDTLGVITGIVIYLTIKKILYCIKSKDNKSIVKVKNK